jgi:hypothetical protein
MRTVKARPALSRAVIAQSLCAAFAASALAAIPPAQTTVTVRQFEDFLHSRRTAKEHDADLAHDLVRVELTERLSDAEFAALSKNLKIGPKSALAVRLIATASVFAPPSARELPLLPPPDAAAQQRILALARASVASSAPSLPDLMAERTTDFFSDAPLFTRKKQKKPVVELHFARETQREVTVRNGREVGFAQPAAGDADTLPKDTPGLTTRGEFGPLLAMIFDDTGHGSLAFARWQNDAGGKPLAVFRYTVPRSVSHDRLNLCCYQASKDDPELVPFRDVPAYHGELFVEPESGALRALIIEDELPDSAPIRSAQKFVEFDCVEIGGKFYLCPVRAVAVAVIEDFPAGKTFGFDRVRFINVVRFSGYHKFGSTARVVHDN